MFRDLRFALRQIWKSPGFSVAVVLTLALGVGVNTAVFSMVNGFLLRPLPYREPDRVGALVVHKDGNNARTGKTFTEEDDSFDARNWQQVNDSVTALNFAAWGGDMSSGANLKASAAAGGVVRYVKASRVSAGYLNVLGVPLYLGRGFTEQEDRPEGPTAAVLSYSLWKSTFGANKDILGKSVELRGAPYTVVGVLARNAVLPDQPDVLVPLRIMSPHGECSEGPNCGILARLKPGMTWEAAEAQLARVRFPNFARIEAQSHGHVRLYARPVKLEFAGDMRGKVQILMLVVGFILLIACANLAGLALVRISRRSIEIATRLALGATGGAVLRQLWMECALLSLLGGVAGLALASLILTGLSNILPEHMIPVGGFGIDNRVIFFTFAAALATSILFGALPALQALRVDLRSAMSRGGRTMASGSGRLRQWMIGAQVALTFVLLVGAGLLVRTLVHLESVSPGFNGRGVLTAKASLDSVRYHQAGAFHDLMRKSVAELWQIPGVEDAAVGLSVPFERGLNTGLMIVDGPHAGGVASSTAYVTPEYFSTLRIPKLAGRTFNNADTADSQPVSVVNPAFGRKFFNTSSPIGRHLKLIDTTYTIVGVVANIAKTPGIEVDAPLSTEPVFYIPVAQTPQAMANVAHIWFQPSWIVRTSHPTSGLTGAMEKAIVKADPNLPISGVYSMDQIEAQQLQTQRMEVLLLTTLAGLALVLSALGIYATVANFVVQRTREVGIRVALGSTVTQAMVQVGRSGLVAAALGLAAGGILSLVTTRALASEIYGISQYDPVTLIAVALLLGAVVSVASLLPTLRLSRISLAETLMTE